VPSLKTALALMTLLVAVAAAGAAIVWALTRSHDGVPERVRACAETRGAIAVKTSEALTAARPDVLAGREPPQRTWRVGQDRVVLMQGLDYAVLVVRAPTNPPLPAKLLRAVYRDPSAYALVVAERAPLHGVLAGCAT
jgi:hypothetical protein